MFLALDEQGAFEVRRISPENTETVLHVPIIIYFMISGIHVKGNDSRNDLKYTVFETTYMYLPLTLNSPCLLGISPLPPTWLAKCSSDVPWPLNRMAAHTSRA